MFKQRRVLAILNPSSGTGDAEALDDKLRTALEAEGAAHVEARFTEGPEDAFDWAAAAADDGFDLVLVGGGDGTVTAVAHGVYRSGSRLPIGILPLGTGNGLARVLGLPLDPEATLSALAAGRIVELDAIDVPSHDALSMLFFGAGLDAEINRDADGEEKARLGPFAYVKAAFANLQDAPDHDLVVTLDGRVERLQGRAISAFNATHLDVLGIDIGPDARPHDGKMQVAVLRRSGFWALLAQLMRLMSRSASQVALEPTRQLRIEATPAMPVQIDGDVVGETPVDAEVIPAAVRFIADAAYEGDRA